MDDSPLTQLLQRLVNVPVPARKPSLGERLTNYAMGGKAQVPVPPPMPTVRRIQTPPPFSAPAQAADQVEQTPSGFKDIGQLIDSLPEMGSGYHGMPVPEKKPIKSMNDLLNKISYVESSNNPNAKSKTSSARGLFQITKGTWDGLVNKYGKEYGIDQEDWMDPGAQRLMASMLLQDNKAHLEKSLDRDVLPEELYVAHFMGPAGAAQLMKSLDSQIPAYKLFPDAAKANRSLFFADNKPRTPKELYNVLINKVR